MNEDSPTSEDDISSLTSLRKKWNSSGSSNIAGNGMEPNCEEFDDISGKAQFSNLQLLILGSLLRGISSNSESIPKILTREQSSSSQNNIAESSAPHDNLEEDCTNSFIEHSENSTSNRKRKAETDVKVVQKVKKKRQRRNPVWPYFNVKDGSAYCLQCTYKTRSVFSTNLKVHLRTHHNNLYQEVLKAEEEQHFAAYQHNVNNQTNIISQSTSKASTSSSNLNNGVFSSHNNHRVHQSTQPASNNRISSNSETIVVSPIAATEAPPSISPASLNGENLIPAMHSTNDLPESSNSSNNRSMSNDRKRRLRRHPVWGFFKDIPDSKSVICSSCTFKTSSPFSTNLKMHMKAHHKSDYALVLRLEAFQRDAEGVQRLSPQRKKSNMDNDDLIEKCSGNSNSADTQMDLADVDSENFQGSSKNSNISETIEDYTTFSSMSSSEKLAVMIEMAASKVTDDCQKGEEISKSDTDEEVNDLHNETDFNSLLTTLQTFSKLSKHNESGLQTKPLISQNQNFCSPNVLETMNQIIHKNIAAQQRASQPRRRTNAANSDSTKSLRTINKLLPTGEVVKIRSRRGDNDTINDNPRTPSITETVECKKASSSSAPILRSALASITAANNVTPSSTNEKQSLADAALRDMLNVHDCCALMASTEFKNFVSILAPDYNLPTINQLTALKNPETQ